MFGKKEIIKLQDQVDELSEQIKLISEKQNAQFTDVMMQLKETREEIQYTKEVGRLYEDGDADGTDDELYEDAKDIVIAGKKASTSWLQRKLGIGYSRAAKLIDTLEQEGVIGPANGASPREILTPTPENN